MKIVFIGLTVSSSWGNGHATTYRGLLKALAAKGHDVYFLEHNKPWYSRHRDFDSSDVFTLRLYDSVDELKKNFSELVESADMVVTGSYVPEGIRVCRWVLNTAKGVRAFYDIDTPVTLENLNHNKGEYIDRDLIPQFDLYLSFSGGEVLDLLESIYDAERARALYCSVDPDIYFPMQLEKKWTLGYLGTYSADRQPVLEKLLINTARDMISKEFAIAGPNYPEVIHWPANITRIDHLSPEMHCDFYNRQRFTLNVTRQAMVKLGYSPSVRLFEAAACGVPIISDYWKGLTGLFREGEEIFIARNSNDVVGIINETPEDELAKVGAAVRQKVLNHHTAAHRAEELISYYEEVKNLVIVGDADSVDL